MCTPWGPRDVGTRDGGIVVTVNITINVIASKISLILAKVMFFSVLRQHAGRFLTPHDTKQIKLFL